MICHLLYQVMICVDLTQQQTIANRLSNNLMHIRIFNVLIL